MNPLVSVIIPVYNSEPYLNDCVKSVLNQTYKNIEIILVNDGSTDKSITICRNLESKYSTIKLINKSNGGLSSARNAGINIATGDYITFVDSDDIIDQTMIATMVDLMNMHDCQIVKIGLKRIYHNDQCTPDISTENLVLTPLQALNKIYDPSARIISMCGKLFDKQLFSTFRFPEGLYYEDEYSAPRIFWAANKILVNFSNLYYYIQYDNDSIMRGTVTDKKIHDSCFVTEERIDFFKTINNKKLLLKAKVDYLYKLEALLKKSIDNNLTESMHYIQLKLNYFRKKNFLIFISIKLKLFLYKILKKFR